MMAYIACIYASFAEDLANISFLALFSKKIVHAFSALALLQFTFM